MLISISKLRLFKSCRRAYQLKYIEGLEPVKKPDALEKGINYHEKIEAIYRNGYCDVLDDKMESAMALAYEKYIYPHFEVKSVEDWFRVPLNADDTLVGRTDGITEDGCLVEHKTCAGSTNLDEYEYSLQWDEQILAYMFATDTRKMYYTLIKKPTIRQRKNESDEDFFNRMCQWYDEDTESKIRVIEITRTDEEVQEFADALADMCAELRTSNYYRNPSYCHHWGRMCEYASVCLHYDPDEEYVEFERRDQ